MVIYGGRNDDVFDQIKNVALNDINLLNTVTMNWMQIATYGKHPCSRWSHIMVPYKSESFNGFLIFGGINLRNYCKSNVHCFNVLNFGGDYRESENTTIVDHYMEKQSNRGMSSALPSALYTNRAGLKRNSSMRRGSTMNIRNIDQSLENLTQNAFLEE